MSNSCIRDRLLENPEFAPNLQILQQYPKDVDIVTIIHKAMELRDIRDKRLRAPPVVHKPEPSPPTRSSVFSFFRSSQ